MLICQVASCFHFRRKAGWLNTALYLMCYVPTKVLQWLVWAYVCNPLSRKLDTNWSSEMHAFHRRMKVRKDDGADRLVKFYLYVFSLSKLIMFYKRENSQYT